MPTYLPIFDDSVFAISRDIMAVIGRFEEQFRVVSQGFDRAQFFTHDGLDEFIGELAIFR